MTINNTLRLSLGRMGKGNRLISSGTLSNPRLDFSSNSFAWDSVIDLSSYAGTDGSSTPYKITLTDGSGKTSTAWLGSAGGGETKGSNQAPTSCCTDPDDDQDNTTGWSAGNQASLDSIAGGKTGNCLEVTENGDNQPFAYKDISVNSGEVWELNLFLKAGTEASYIVRLRNQQAANYIYTASGEEISGDWSTEVNAYITIPTGCTTVRIQLINDCPDSTGATFLFDDVTFKQVTDCATTGLHAYTTRGGSTRGWDEESGFDRNASSYTYAIYR